MSQATVEDVAVRMLRPLDPAETAWVAVRLVDAFTQILTVAPAAGARLDAAADGDPFPQLVIQIQAAMVLRVLANPDHARQQVGDNYTVVLDQAVSSGALYVTVQELDLLTAVPGGAGVNGGAFSVRPRPDLPAPAW